MYADEAKTGTKDSRENFQRLLADCRRGKIDRVLTKSVSRFARNTVTLLETVRELKSMGISVYFEESSSLVRHTPSAELSPAPSAANTTAARLLPHVPFGSAPPIIPMIRVCINGNASNTMTEEEYRAKHTEL